MGQRKIKAEKRHMKRLMASARSDVYLCFKVEEDFLAVCKMHLRTKGHELFVPASLDKELMHWREMRFRYMKKDFRHKLIELKSLHAVAQWVLDVKNELTGQEKVQLEWAYGEG